MRTPRRRAREFAVQALYQRELNRDFSVTDIINNIRESDAYIEAINHKKAKVDEALFLELVQGVSTNAQEYLDLMRPYSERNEDEVSPVELAVLLLACHELKNMPATPYPVIINEAIEIAKAYGSTDGYKFINGILDKLALNIRPNEVKN